MKKIFILFFFVWFGLTSSSYAADYENCLNAYEKKDYVAALKLCRPFAEQGDVEAQKNLGNMYGVYAQESGVVQDYKEAVKWYRFAAEQGHVLAQFGLGMIYAQGNGVTKDFEEAIKWYQLAADQGYRIAQNKLGNLLFYGLYRRGLM